MKASAIEAAKNVYDIEAECIRQMAGYFDEEAFTKAVDLLLAAPRIGAAGCGHSGIICQHFVHLMCCANLSARFLSPSEAVHGASGYLKEGDVCVFASRGGKTGELIPIMSICKARGVHTIVVTANPDSPLAKDADVVLHQHVTRETDRYNIQGTTSSTALAVIFHTLQTAICEETGVGEENFAVIHPGGGVGARLNKKDLC